MEQLLPSLVVFGTAGVLIVIAGLTIRAVQRGPRARARREVVWNRAGSALVRLDDTIEESDIELGLAGAMYGATAPRALASTRARAAETRDVAFARYQQALERKEKEPSAAREARRIGDTVSRSLLALENAQAQHKQWLTTNADAAAQVKTARESLTALTESVGDPYALENELAHRFAAGEVEPIREAMERVRSGLAKATDAIARAEKSAASPGYSVIADLAEGERHLRAVESASTAAEQSYRGVIDASIAVGRELTAVRADISRGVRLQEQVPPEAAERFGDALAQALRQVEALEARATAEPTAVIAAISRVRDRLDLELGSARSARDRLEGARSALPGTMASARAAVAHAETIVAQSSSADARVRLVSAHEALAASRSAADAVAALDAVRRGIRHAEDAVALANYSREHGSK